jgi:hypothetical protein
MEIQEGSELPRPGSADHPPLKVTKGFMLCVENSFNRTEMLSKGTLAMALSWHFDNIRVPKMRSKEREHLKKNYRCGCW